MRQKYKYWLREWQWGNELVPQQMYNSRGTYSRVIQEKKKKRHRIACYVNDRIWGFCCGDRKENFSWQSVRNENSLWPFRNAPNGKASWQAMVVILWLRLSAKLEGFLYFKVSKIWLLYENLPIYYGVFCPKWGLQFEAQDLESLLWLLFIQYGHNQKEIWGGLDVIWLQLDMFPRCTHKGKNMFMSASVLSSSQRTFNSSVHKDY